MTTIITDKSKVDSTTYFTATCGKITAHVSHHDDGRVGVCVLNASHRAWKRMGKFFASFELAVESYKSESVRQILWATKAEVVS